MRRVVYTSYRMSYLLLFDIFRFGYLVLFAVLETMLMIGIYREWRRDRRSLAASPDLQARVSVIIPIHNERMRMQGLLDSLLEQDHPAEIIFIDDRSDDGSAAMLAQFVRDACGRGMGNCRIITLKENPGPNYKQYALGRGIAEASGDFLLFTDGDCALAPGWIGSMALRMADGNTGVVIGPVLKKYLRKNFFYLYQCFDHEVRYNHLAGAVGLGAAGGSFGNNLIVSRKALDEAGGYGAVPPSVTEDAALVSLLRSHTRYKVRAAVLPDAVVETVAENSWRALISQTLRWNNGGLFSPDVVTRINYNLLMLLITIGVLAIPLLPFFPGLWPLPLCVYFVLLENTVAAFCLFRSKLPKGGIFTALGYFSCLLFTPLYFALMTIMGYLRVKIKWKEKELA